MAKLRAGPTFTQDILGEFITAVEAFGSTEEAPDTAFRHVTQALHKFLSYGMSRFSVETLQSVIDDLLASNGLDGREQSGIRSLTQLRTVVKMTMTRRDAGSLQSRDASALKYLETFFYCVYCMSEAKRMFDRVYENLYFAYFDPNGISRQSTKVPSAQAKDRLPHKDNRQTEVEDYSQFGISTLQQMTGSTHHKLRQTASDMKDVLERWSQLLTDEEPDTKSFDPESEEDLHLLHGVSGSETILRLVPDLFAKYYKCMELTKQWWVLAHDAYPDVPFRRRPSRADTDTDIDFARSSSSSQGDTDSLFSDRSEVTNEEIEAMKVTIIENQKVINSIQEEIEALDKREERFEILKETYEKVGNEVENKKKEQKRLRVDRDRLNPEENKEALSVIGQQLDSLDGSIRLLEFQHALLLEDFMIHLEIRPSIIRFQDEAKMNLQEAQATREKQMSHLQKLRDSAIVTPTTDKAKTPPPKPKVPVPTIVRSSHSPETSSKAGPQTQTSNHDQKVRDRDKGHKPRVLPAVEDESKKASNRLRRDSKEQMGDKRNQTGTQNDGNGSVKTGNSRHPSKANNDIPKAETKTKEENVSEKKISILKHANSKQNLEPVNSVQNTTSEKSVSKRRIDEQQPQQPQQQQQQQHHHHHHQQQQQQQHITTTNQNLRRTYDVPKRTETSQATAKQDSESNSVPQKSEKKSGEKNPKKAPTSSPWEPSSRAIEPNRHAHARCHAHTHAHTNRHNAKKDTPDSNDSLSPSTKEGNPVKPVRKTSREDAVAPPSVKKTGNKKPAVPSKAALSVGSK